jgi:glycerol-3-phosphate O-acyltransferase
MHDLEPLLADAHLAIGAQPLARQLQAPLLLGAEVEEAQPDAARAVAGGDQQHAPAGITDLGALHARRHQGRLAGPELRQRRQMGAVLIAKRQVEQQVLQRVQAQRLEPLRHRRADAAQPRDRAVRDKTARCRHDALAFSGVGTVADATVCLGEAHD